MTVEEHGPNEETLDLLEDMLMKIDSTADFTIDRGTSETWLTIKGADSRSVSKFIGKRGKVFNAMRTLATVFSGVDRHRYMLRVC